MDRIFIRFDDKLAYYYFIFIKQKLVGIDFYTNDNDFYGYNIQSNYWLNSRKPSPEILEKCCEYEHKSIQMMKGI